MEGFVGEGRGDVRGTGGERQVDAGHTPSLDVVYFCLFAGYFFSCFCSVLFVKTRYRSAAGEM